mmetsp:Transcript_109952/g.310788  ORF Transcript_109952/g.310788 Transcript_109952/m.310788 type:complete len:210 (+) Transcript_109952:39-668(+)
MHGLILEMNGLVWGKRCSAVRPLKHQLLEEATWHARLWQPLIPFDRVAPPRPMPLQFLRRIEEGDVQRLAPDLPRQRRARVKKGIAWGLSEHAGLLQHQGRLQEGDVERLIETERTGTPQCRAHVSGRAVQRLLNGDVAGPLQSKRCIQEGDIQQLVDVGLAEWNAAGPLKSQGHIQESDVQWLVGKGSTELCPAGHLQRQSRVQEADV